MCVPALRHKDHSLGAINGPAEIVTQTDLKFALPLTVIALLIGCMRAFPVRRIKPDPIPSSRFVQP